MKITSRNFYRVLCNIWNPNCSRKLGEIITVAL